MRQDVIEEEESMYRGKGQGIEHAMQVKEEIAFEDKWQSNGGMFWSRDHISGEPKTIQSGSDLDLWGNLAVAEA